MSWSRLHPCTRVLLFLGTGLYAALCGRAVVQMLIVGVLLVIVLGCGVLQTHWRLVIWLHLVGLPWAAVVFVLAGYEQSHLWTQALSWGLLEAAKYALRLESLFLANLAMIGTVTMRELTELFTHRWVPTAIGVPLLTAVRFIPTALMESRRIYSVQRCRGLRLRPWSPRTWLPVLVPLFVSQMQRAHDMALMLVVRRITPGTGLGTPRRLRALDYAVLSLAVAGCICGRL